MSAIINEITKLTDEWYFLIGKDHHKDRDCHWYIETRWSYGYSPVYTVQHDGYILHDFEEIECSSYEEALNTLRNVLTEKIEEEKKIQEERKNEDEL
jgi:hypothetical protein